MNNKKFFSLSSISLKEDSYKETSFSFNEDIKRLLSFNIKNIAIFLLYKKYMYYNNKYIPLGLYKPSTSPLRSHLGAGGIDYINNASKR